MLASLKLKPTCVLEIFNSLQIVDLQVRNTLRKTIRHLSYLQIMYIRLAMVVFLQIVVSHNARGHSTYLELTRQV